MTREVWITGIGLLSSLGEGPEAHWAGLTQAHPQPNLDAASHAPYPIHPLATVDFDKQIPKKGDQRQMEPWQRIGTYAAGLALTEAGVAGNAALLDNTHMIVAAGGGERDTAVDLALTRTLAAGNAEDGALLNQRLSTELRPTLFLAQLPNLLAGSISIVHGVRGSSRTFMGEESAGFDAVRIAAARLAAAQCDLALVGGSFNAARPDLMMLYAAGQQLLRGDYRPVWQRQQNPGFALGSIGAFLVLEERRHAEARGARGLARLQLVLAEKSDRQGDAAASAAASATQIFAQVAPLLGAGTLGVISGATGGEPATEAERLFLAEAGLGRTLAVRASGTLLGHGIEAQFPANVALAALALSRGGFYPPFEAGGMEAAAEGPVRQVMVTGFGQRRGEALALLETI